MARMAGRATAALVVAAWAAPGAAQEVTPEAARAALQGELNRLAAAQQEHAKQAGGYATSLRQLPTLRPAADVNLVLLVAAADGWSAVATHDAVPSLRCVGTAGPFMAGGAVTVACQADLPVAGTGGGATVRATSPSVADSAAGADAPPRVIECKEPPPTEGMAEGVSLVSFVVGADGRVEPAGIRVLQSPALPNSVWAIAAVGSCSYQPATRAGEPVRATVTRRVRYAAPAAAPKP